MAFTPISANATAKTVNLYNWLLKAKGTGRHIVGTSDMIWDMPDTAPGGTTYIHGTQDYFFDASGGKWPGFLAFEYHDPAWENRWGSTATDLVRTTMIAAAKRGSILGLHIHPGNPVTGQMSRNGLSWRDPSTGTGNYGDRSGSPLAAIKTGGAQEAQFLAWMDRMAAFINSLVFDNGERIPVILRPFHENGPGTWFWWNGADRAADLKLVWQKFVTYMRDVKGLTSVLYCWNVNVGTDSNFFPYWPTSAYVDIISIDIYDNRNTPAASLEVNGQTQPCYDFLVNYATTANRPFVISELGYQYHIENNITDIWDVKTGDLIRGKYNQTGLAAIWDRPWGPQPSDPQAFKTSFTSWVSNPDARTAERTGDVLVDTGDMASIADAGTRPELVALYREVGKLEVMLRQVVDGSSSPTNPGRFTVAQIEAAITATQAAITAATTV